MVDFSPAGESGLSLGLARRQARSTTRETDTQATATDVADASLSEPALLSEPGEAPLIESNPLQAIGIVLGNIAAGFEGRELPSDRFINQQFRKRQQELQQFQAQIGLVNSFQNLSKNFGTEEERQAFAQAFGKRFEGTFPGITGLLTEAGKLPDIEKVLGRAGRFSREVQSICGQDVQCVLDVTRDDKLMNRVEQEHDLRNAPVVREKFSTIMDLLAENEPDIAKLIGESAVTLADVEQLNKQLPDRLKLSRDEFATLQNSEALQLELGIATPKILTELAKNKLKPDQTEVVNSRDSEGNLVTQLINKETGELIREINRGPTLEVQIQRDRQLSFTEAQQLGVPLGTTTSEVAGQVPPSRAELAQEKAELEATAEEATSLRSSAQSIELIRDQLGQTAETFARPLPRRLFELDLPATRAGGPRAAFERVLEKIQTLIPGDIPGLRFEDQTDIITAVNAFNKELERGLANNPRFPVAEIERLKRLFPTPDGIFNEPETELQKMQSLSTSLADTAHRQRLQAEGKPFEPREGSLNRPFEPQTETDMDKVKFGDFFINPADGEIIRRD